jgi:hypothetical protein
MSPREEPAPGAADGDRPSPQPGPQEQAGGEDRSWQARRREAAALHAEALARTQQAETAQARALIAEFVRKATARGLPPQPLSARSYDGRARYRTPLQGWYLRRNESVAVGTDGLFYVLTVPPSLRARLSGVTPSPSDPPIILGKGGRDGESIDLADALARVLAGDG